MPVCPKCHLNKPIADFTRQNGKGPRVYRSCNDCVNDQVKDVGPPEFLFPDPHFAQVCLTCPLSECDPESHLCPIRVKGRKRLSTEEIIKVNKAAGNELKFRRLTAGSKRSILKELQNAITASA
jgi:hypothetical protein